MSLLITALIAAAIPPIATDTPNRQPQLAASNGLVALVFGSGRSVMFSKSLDQGRTFSTPVQVAEAPVLPLSRHRGPACRVFRAHNSRYGHCGHNSGYRPSCARSAFGWQSAAVAIEG